MNDQVYPMNMVDLSEFFGSFELGLSYGITFDCLISVYCATNTWSKPDTLSMLQV